MQNKYEFKAIYKQYTIILLFFIESLIKLVSIIIPLSTLHT